MFGFLQSVPARKRYAFTMARKVNESLDDVMKRGAVRAREEARIRSTRRDIGGRAVEGMRASDSVILRELGVVTALGMVQTAPETSSTAGATAGLVPETIQTVTQRLSFDQAGGPFGEGPFAQVDRRISTRRLAPETAA